VSSGWQQDWSLFVATLADCLRAGDTSEKLAQRFGGKEVTWQGVLDEKNIDGLAPLVGITLPQKEIELGQGRSAILDGLSLPIAAHTIEQWSRLELGTPLTFTAILGPSGSLFAPIEVKILRSGRTIVFIRLADAVPVRS